MDTDMDITTTQRGRQTKTPAKFQQTGSLGAAVGGGGLLSSKIVLLPGISGNTHVTTGGAAATNTQSEGGAGRRRGVATTAPTPPGKGKNKAADAKQQLQAIMADRRFSDDTATADSIVNVGNSDDSNSDSDR
ncbi:unnamed protein product [Ectocarpus sp. CCAP 1310/34]|nr:unnamed protein product [Ectocarpus sp. CCAP 1310/34]CAB1106630.1 unnamed protein product [Ectocarpus sp. CCAP 1310/34]CAB1116238.1 unnamed protein product [Ectocarpus sp. CCAP 1310/34]CAB1119064.1 unnamed protein product [Ectocarpus sp. CCAP 1310/34]